MEKEQAQDKNGTKSTVVEDKQKINKTKGQKAKRRNYKKELLAVQQELEALKDQYLRVLAEFDNYKKRRERDFFNLVENANVSLVEDLLPILDDFDRSFNSTHKGKTSRSFKKGIELIYDKFKGILAKQGLETIEAQGEAFNPELHEAIMQVEAEHGQPSNTVVQEAVKGYKFKDMVVRHSKVVVSK